MRLPGPCLLTPVHTVGALPVMWLAPRCCCQAPDALLRPPLCLQKPESRPPPQPAGRQHPAPLAPLQPRCRLSSPAAGSTLPERESYPSGPLPVLTALCPGPLKMSPCLLSEGPPGLCSGPRCLSSEQPSWASLVGPRMCHFSAALVSTALWCFTIVWPRPS